jgi:hypothetical protein
MPSHPRPHRAASESSPRFRTWPWQRHSAESILCIDVGTLAEWYLCQSHVSSPHSDLMENSAFEIIGTSEDIDWSRYEIVEDNTGLPPVHTVEAIKR